MSIRISTVASVALTLAVVVLGTDVAAQEARIAVATGGVSTRYYKNTEFKKSKSRGTARAGQQLRCDGSCELTMRHGVQVAMTKGSVVRPSSPMFVRLDGDKRARRCDTLEVIGGEVTLSRPESDAAPLLVQVAGRQLALHHGTARLRPRASALGMVLETGRASLHAGKWRALRSGHSYTVAEEMVERPAVVQPRWWPGAVGDRPMALIAHGDEGNLGLAWSPVAGASRYVLEVSATAGFETLVRTKMVAARFTHAALRLPHGRHYARVFAEDVEGFRSRPSATRQAGVVRVSLPSGGTLGKRGRMKLPLSAQLRFHEHEALEFRTLHNPFVAAPESLAAPPRSTVVLLRFKGDRHTRTSFWLQQHELNVRFAMTPEQPIWP